jgi:uncharacterized LabA/DUF88 family protein
MNNKKDAFIPPRNKSDMTNHLRKLIAGKRVSIYIDSANLYFASNIAKIKIDFIHLSKWFREHCKLTGINFYTAYDPEEQKQLDFLTELTDEGYRIVKKPVKIFENSKKGNMDIELAVDCITQKDLYDIVILLSGDGDFSYLIQALDTMGKDTIILGIGGFTSYELHQEADNYYFLNRIMDVWSSRRKNTRNNANPNPILPMKNESLNIDETKIKTNLSESKIAIAQPKKIKKTQLKVKETTTIVTNQPPKKSVTTAKPTTKISRKTATVTTNTLRPTIHLD